MNTKSNQNFYYCFEKRESGSSLAISMIVVFLVSATAVGLQSYLGNRIDSIGAITKSSSSEIWLGSTIGRLNGIMKIPGGFGCSQMGYGGNCPAFYPDPVDCNSAKIRNFTTVPGWTVVQSASNSTFILDAQPSTQSTFDSRSIPKNGPELGSIEINVPDFKSASGSVAGSLMQTNLASYNPFQDTSAAKIKVSFEGSECKDNKYISALYANIEYMGADKDRLPKKNLRIPIDRPSAGCLLSLSKTTILPGEEIDYRIVANGAWSQAWGPEGQGVSNPSYSKSLLDDALALTGRIKPVRSYGCSLTGWVQGQVTDLEGQGQGCYASVMFDIPEAQYYAECPSADPVNIAAAAAAAEAAAAEAGTTYTPIYQPPSYSSVREAAREVVPAVACPSDYYVQENHVNVRMIYIPYENECLAVRAGTQ
jgi:hypothetical protein